MTRPLEGRRIIITRSPRQAGSFRSQLEALGATVLEVPTIEIAPRPEAELDRLIEQIPNYDWLFFTSVNGARIVLARWHFLSGGSLSTVSVPRVAVIGPATARKVESFGLSVALSPDLYQAEGMLEAFCAMAGGPISGLRIILPRASQAREILPQELRRLGASVDVVPVYDTILPEEGRTQLLEALKTGPVDLVTFTSSSTVHNFVAMAGEIDLNSLPCSAIGPITAATAREHGLQIVLESERSSIPDFVASIEKYFSTPGR